VTFYVGPIVLATVALNSGTASLSTSTLPVGTHNIRAVYDGSADFNTSRATLSQVVEPASGGAPRVAAASPIELAIAALSDELPDGSTIVDLAVGILSPGGRKPRA
jgi:Bacterial Ig-like domain (group 3)